MARTRAVLMAALLVPFAGLASPALAQASLAMLDTLDRGGWEVRFRDDNSMRKVCIRSGREFIRLRHSGGNCNRFVVEDADRNVTAAHISVRNRPAWCRSIARELPTGSRSSSRPKRDRRADVTERPTCRSAASRIAEPYE